MGGTLSYINQAVGSGQSFSGDSKLCQWTVKANQDRIIHFIPELSELCMN